MNPVVVVGAGPAGMMAAGRAAERGHKIILLEKNPRAGCKILVSGGGRCNLTNTRDRQEFISAFGRNGRFLHSTFARFFTDDLRELLERLGVPTKADDDGKVFPSSGKASDVLAALENWMKQLHVDVRTGVPINDVIINHTETSGGKTARWVTAARTPMGDIPASAVIVCTGGITYPQLGTTGDGYNIARRLGHTIVPCHPCLAGLHSPDPICRKMQGVSISARITARDETVHPPRQIARREGSIIFTHFGISGPAVLDISRDVAPVPGDGGQLSLLIDLLPSEHDFAARIAADCLEAPRKTVMNYLRGFLPVKMAEPLLEQCSIQPDKRLGQITRGERRLLETTLKGLSLKVTGSEGIERAMVTRGGISLREIDSSTMQSRLIRGLCFAGEALDIDGPTGGYNLQAAFSTGWLAGDSI